MCNGSQTIINNKLPPSNEEHYVHNIFTYNIISSPTSENIILAWQLRTMKPNLEGAQLTTIIIS